MRSTIDISPEAEDEVVATASEEPAALEDDAPFDLLDAVEDDMHVFWHEQSFLVTHAIAICESFGTTPHDWHHLAGI